MVKHPFTLQFYNWSPPPVPGLQVFVVFLLLRMEPNGASFSEGQNSSFDPLGMW
jgi:hypothetical protein